MLSCIERDAGALTMAASRLAQYLPVFQRGGVTPAIIYCVDALAGLSAACGQFESTLRLAGAADRLWERMGCDPRRVYRFGLERWPGSARQVLGDRDADLEYASGRELTRTAAIAEALTVARWAAVDADGSSRTLSLSNRMVLTRRERQIAALIARGRTNREIAEELVTAVSTTERHVANILGKLGLRSRTEIALWAVAQRHAPRPTNDSSNQSGEFEW
jgi:non-specific serine/threonine protein kinase